MAMNMAKPANVADADWSALQSALGAVTSPSFGVTPAQLNSGALTPDQLGNDPKLEQQWAELAAKHAETYQKLLTAIKPRSKLRLTKIDDEIYQSFRAKFPNLKIEIINEDQLKSAASKSLWRDWLMQYKERDEIKDFHFGTLMRADCRKGYEMETGGRNAIVVPRMQFLAIEIARNKEGLNDKFVA